MSEDELVKIQEQVNERKYWIQVPNLIDELDLSPYAVRLYLRLKRRAGENGICYESSSNLARGCRMSTHKIVDAKRELQAAGLISIYTEKGKHGGRDYHVIQIIDIWHKNFEYFASQVSSRNLQDADLHFANCISATKEEPIKKKAKEGKREASRCSPPSPSLHAVSAKPHGEREEQNSRSVPSLQTHPAIQAVKDVSNYYPPKVLYPEIIKCLGDSPDIARLTDCFKMWVANGHNPQNYEGWLFDWYPNGRYYANPNDKHVLEYS